MSKIVPITWNAELRFGPALPNQILTRSFCVHSFWPFSALLEPSASVLDSAALGAVPSGTWKVGEVTCQAVLSSVPREKHSTGGRRAKKDTNATSCTGLEGSRGRVTGKEDSGAESVTGKSLAVWRQAWLLYLRLRVVSNITA